MYSVQISSYNESSIDILYYSINSFASLRNNSDRLEEKKKKKKIWLKRKIADTGCSRK